MGTDSLKVRQRMVQRGVARNQAAGLERSARGDARSGAADALRGSDARRGFHRTLRQGPLSLLQLAKHVEQGSLPALVQMIVKLSFWQLDPATGQDADAPGESFRADVAKLAEARG